jgi:hypothetical protein
MPDARAGQHQGAVRVFQHNVPERRAEHDLVTHLHRTVQQAGHLPIGCVQAVDPFDGKLAVLPVVGPGQAVLPGLMRSVRHQRLQRDVLSGK